MGRFGQISICVGLVCCMEVCRAQTTQPTTAPTANDASIDPAAALKAASNRVQAQFESSPDGRDLAEQVTAAEKKRDDAKASGSSQDLSDAAMQLVNARAAYDRALRALLNADPDVKAATVAAAAHPALMAVDSSVPVLNRMILDFAARNMGKEVGNGECWTLADEAMKSAGTTHPDVYIWGRALAKNEKVLPGDIIQFKSVRLQMGTRWELLGDPDHTAIVRKVNSRGVYVILHQNYGQPGKVVSELTIDTNLKTAGDFVIYRPGNSAGIIDKDAKTSAKRS
jgi:hypothetical protein